MFTAPHAHQKNVEVKLTWLRFFFACILVFEFSIIHHPILPFPPYHHQNHRHEPHPNSGKLRFCAFSTSFHTFLTAKSVKSPSLQDAVAALQAHHHGRCGCASKPLASLHQHSIAALMSIEANDLSRLSVQLWLAGEPMHLHKNHGPMVNSTARLLIHGMKLFLMTWSTLYSQMMSKGFTTLQCLNTYFKACSFSNLSKVPNIYIGCTTLTLHCWTRFSGRTWITPWSSSRRTS